MTRGMEPAPSPRAVFVVHGRDDRARSAIMEFLRAIDLHPVEWEEARAATGRSTPYVLDIVRAGFSMAKAAVVLFTPDDVVMLRPEYRRPGDPPYEATLTG